MQGGTATEGNDSETAHVLAVFHGVDPGRVGHVLVDHLDDTFGCRVRRQPERGTDPGVQSRPGCLLGQVDARSAERVGRQATQDQVSVSHRGGRTPQPVGGGTGFGTCAEWPDADLAQHVHAGDGSASGSDLDHLDDRDGDGHPAAPGEPVGAGHLKRFGRPGRLVLDEADLGCGSAHVVGEHSVQAVTGRDVGGEDGPSGRPGFHEAHREP